MKRTLSLAFKAYCLLGALFLTAAATAAAAGFASGKMSSAKVKDLARLALADPAAHSDAEAAAGDGKKIEGSAKGAEGAAKTKSGAAGAAAAAAKPGEAAVVPASSSHPAELLREIERASEDLRRWEDRINLLGQDVRAKSTDAGKQVMTLLDEKKAWEEVKLAMVPLLNQLLAGTPGWRAITEEEFNAAITGKAGLGGEEAKGEDGRKAITIPDLLDRLRRRESTFADTLGRLKELQPEVLAAILAGGLKSSRSGGAPRGQGQGQAQGTGETTLSEEQMVRLLSTLDPAKLAKVFKVLKDEDPAQAASLLALVMRGPAGAGDGAAGGKRSERIAEPAGSAALPAAGAAAGPATIAPAIPSAKGGIASESNERSSTSGEKRG